MQHENFLKSTGDLDISLEREGMGYGHFPNLTFDIEPTYPQYRALMMSFGDDDSDPGCPHLLPTASHVAMATDRYCQ